MRDMCQIYCVENKKKEYNSACISMITAYKIKNNIINGNFDKSSFYNETLDKREFVEMIDGSKAKDLLFQNNSINSKRESIEYFTKLYYLIADKDDGITARGLAKCIDISMSLYEKNLILSPNDANANKYLGFAEEIIGYLGRDSSGKLTPEDFINIMTSEVGLPKEL